MGNENGRAWTPERLAALRAAHEATPAQDKAIDFWRAGAPLLGMTAPAFEVACQRNGLPAKVKDKADRAKRTYTRG